MAPTNEKEANMQMTQTDARQRLAPIEALAQQGRIDEALVQIETLVKDAPQLADAHNDMAVLYHAKGRYEDALGAISKAMALAPTDASVQRNHVAIQIARGRPGEAARALEPVLVKNPRDGEALALAGDIAMVTGRSDDAVAFYQAALSVEPSLPQTVREKLHAAEKSKQSAPTP